MSELQVTVHLTLRPGVTSQFERIAAQALAAARDADPGTIRYDWYFDDTRGACVILEAFESSTAFLAHTRNVGPYLQQLSELAEIEVAVFGDASAEVREAATKMGAPIFREMQRL